MKEVSTTRAHTAQKDKYSGTLYQREGGREEGGGGRLTYERAIWNEKRQTL